MVPAGVNVIDGKRIDEAELEEEIFVTDRKELAVNVSASKDLKTTVSLFKRLTS